MFLSCSSDMDYFLRAALKKYPHSPTAFIVASFFYSFIFLFSFMSTSLRRSFVPLPSYSAHSPPSLFLLSFFSVILSLIFTLSVSLPPSSPPSSSILCSVSPQPSLPPPPGTRAPSILLLTAVNTSRRSFVATSLVFHCPAVTRGQKLS